MGGDPHQSGYQPQEVIVQNTTITAVINRVRYSVASATLIASNEYWDGHNWERYGTNTHLYRTKNARYFAVHEMQWQGCHDTIEPLSIQEAADLYEELRVKEVEFEDAFPSLKVTEA